MPKVTLSFKLPEEEEEFKMAHEGASLSAKINEFDNWLRHLTKYTEMDEKEYAVYSAVRHKLWEILNNE